MEKRSIDGGVVDAVYLTEKNDNGVRHIRVEQACADREGMLRRLLEYSRKLSGKEG